MTKSYSSWGWILLLLLLLAGRFAARARLAINAPQPMSSHQALK